MKQRSFLRCFAVSTVLLIACAARAQDVRISEFLASNANGLLDEDGDASDWVEVYNPGPSAASLEGWFLTDDTADLMKWRFPATNVSANAYLLVFASGKNRATPGALCTQASLSRPVAVTSRSSSLTASPSRRSFPMGNSSPTSPSGGVSDHPEPANRSSAPTRR